MGSVLEMYGFCVGSVWILYLVLYGFCMGSGIRMDSVWDHHGFCKDSVEDSGDGFCGGFCNGFW